MKENKIRQIRMEEHKYVVILCALISFILTPIHIALWPISQSLIVVANFSILIVAGFFICQHLRGSIFYYGIAVLTLISVWLEYVIPGDPKVFLLRFIASSVLFIFLTFVLIRELFKDKYFNLKSILGAMSGYLFIGLIGGILFEGLHYMHPESFTGEGMNRSYTFYYFSFVSITSVGYGDVVPALPTSQSLAIVLNIIGQFYLTVVVAVFVGQFLNNRTNKE